MRLDACGDRILADVEDIRPILQRAKEAGLGPDPHKVFASMVAALLSREL